MATLIVCPRCQGALQPDARACPRCGLVLDEHSVSRQSDSFMPDYSGVAQSATRTPERNVYEPSTVEYTHEDQDTGGTSAYADVRGPVPSQPVRSDVQTDQRYNTRQDAASASSGRLVPRGAVELLPQESVVFQLGALYLTNKRVILLAPSVIRAAFLRDVDAVGTLTERSSGWSLFFGLMLLGLAGASVYASLDRAVFIDTFPWLYLVDPIISAVVLGIAAAVLLATYFLWIKRTLFVSVRGRPLITVSISEWNSRKLAGMDAFVNAFFNVKDAVSNGEHYD